MNLFEFELKKIEDIEPWGAPEKPSLSWFALTDGTFRVEVGEQTLLRYSPEIVAHWNFVTPDADYQVAAFAREILGSFAHVIVPLPGPVERLARNWPLLEAFHERSGALLDDDSDLTLDAWRWLGERTPWMSYLQANPSISFVRVGDSIDIHWNNIKLLIDGIKVWTASCGTFRLSVTEFVRECESFAERLLKQMEVRLLDIETGASTPRAAVDGADLRKQHETWRREFDGYLHEMATPEVPWTQTVGALQSLATRLGVVLP